VDSGNTNLEVTNYRTWDFFEYDEMELISLGRAFLLYRSIQAFLCKVRYLEIYFRVRSVSAGMKRDNHDSPVWYSTTMMPTSLRLLPSCIGIAQIDLVIRAKLVTNKPA
jgi:hypothetical protein